MGSTQGAEGQVGRESLRPLPIFSIPRLWAVSGRRPRGGGGLELPEDLSAEEKTGIPGCRCAFPHLLHRVSVDPVGPQCPQPTHRPSGGQSGTSRLSHSAP